MAMVIQCMNYIGLSMERECIRMSWYIYSMSCSPVIPDLLVLSCHCHGVGTNRSGIRLEALHLFRMEMSLCS